MEELEIGRDMENRIEFVTNLPLGSLSYPSSVVFLPDESSGSHAHNCRKPCYVPLIIAGSSDSTITMWNI